MFYTNCAGCLGLIITFFISILFFKFFGLALLILIILIIYRPGLLNKLKSSNRGEFKAKPGEVYKVCQFCQSSAPKNAERCQKCGRPFEV